LLGGLKLQEESRNGGGTDEADIPPGCNKAGNNYDAPEP